MKGTNRLVLFLSIFFLSLNGCILGITKAKRAEKIHEKILTIDSHVDWPYRQYLNPEFNPSIRNDFNSSGSGQWDILRMQEGGLDAVFMAVFTFQNSRTTEGHIKAKEQAIKMIELIQKMLEENPDTTELALTPEDAYRIEKAKKRAIFMGMENGYPLGKKIDNVKLFQELGIRYITLTHTKNNEIGDSSTDKKQEWEGLSPFGKEVVKEMNRLGMMIDISHVHDDTFWDVIELTKAPIIASHSNVRSLIDTPRNLNDKMLKAIQKNGGVVQICFYDNYVKKIPQLPERQAALEGIKEKQEAWIRGELSMDEIAKLREQYRLINEKYPKIKPTLFDAIDHIDYIVKNIGIDHVGIGSDFDGGGGLIGINDVSQMQNITQELVARGYTEEDVRKIWGGNLMRVFSEVILVSEKIKQENF